jgi:hypothetical protein
MTGPARGDPTARPRLPARLTHRLVRLALLLAGCVTVWSYPLGTAGDVGPAVRQMLELRVCDHGGRQVLEAVRVMTWTDGRALGELPELRLPWGAREPVKP